jgi:hypothetical protein
MLLKVGSKRDGGVREMARRRSAVYMAAERVVVVNEGGAAQVE